MWSFGVILYTVTIGHLPFVNNTSDGEGDTMPKLVKKIGRGLRETHFKEMNALSIDLRVLLMRCLDVKPATRATVKSITTDPWISVSGGRITDSEANLKIDEVEMAAKLKAQLNIKMSPEQIMAHVKKRRLGTTAGCINLLKIEEYKKFRQEGKGTLVRQRSSKDGAKRSASAQPPTPKPEEEPKKESPKKTAVTTNKKSPKDEKKVGVEDERRGRSRDRNAPSGWRRSFLNLAAAAGRISYSRLRRTEGEEEKKEEEASAQDTTKTDSGLITKALGDISNSVRPLLRRNSTRKEAKPAKEDDKIECPDIQQAMLPPPSAKKKLRMRPKQQEQQQETKRRPRKPIR